MEHSTLTIQDLINYAMRAQRLRCADYAPYMDAYTQDRNRIKQAKRKARKAADFCWHCPDTPLQIGEYAGGRLQVTAEGICYIAGQYEPTEIWWAVEDYFLKYRKI